MRLIDLEDPDLVVHTGDIIDWDTKPASAGMDNLYGVTFHHNLPFAATLGNHDGQSDLNREQVVKYFSNGTWSHGFSHATIGPQGLQNTGSFGNYYMEITDANGTTVMRTYHLDANTNNESINPQQVSWFSTLSRQLNQAHPAPALMFFHIPLVEYDIALRTHTPISGHANEAVCFNGNASFLFDAIQTAGDVKATFVGHDHTNDYCANYQGVQLCYEGSPGYQAYGRPFWPRRARVTQISEHGRLVRSWKRLDDAKASVVDKEVLWAARAEEGEGRGSVVVGEGRRAVHVDVDALPRLEQH